MNRLIINNVSLQLDNQRIINEVNLDLKSGKVYGFVGKNGSGKTMLFRIISGLLKPTAGDVFYNDLKLHQDIECLPSCGLILENVGLYPDLSSIDNLKMLGNLKNKVSLQTVIDCIKRVGLDPNNKKPFSKFSLGMKKKALLAQAILEQPEVLILDEPSAALDMDGKDILYSIVNEAKNRGCLVLLSSHDFHDIQTLSDEIYHIQDGQVSISEGVK